MGSEGVKTVRCAVMSKKRYTEIGELLAKWMDDPQAIAAVHRGIAEVMHYDPEKGMYRPEAGRRVTEARRKAAAEAGVSTYELRNGRAYYERKKEARSKDVVAT